VLTAPVHTLVALWAGASSIQAPAAHDSILRLSDSLTGRFLDSVVVKSPLPDPLVPIVQWIFQRPPWVMLTGLIVGAIVVIAILVLLRRLLFWRSRARAWDWLTTRDRGVKLALGAALSAVLLAIVAGGLKANDYVMHDNDFCRGCHIFVPSGQVFVQPDTGDYLLVNQLEGKHDSLSCHSCHPFNLKTQTKELFYWIVERPDKIPPHAKVPRTVCEQCHVQGAAKKTWQRIASTAGHRTHLESDSSALKKVECLTCHARTAHRFQPVDTTCAQKGCHLTDEVKIKLGSMAARFDKANPNPLPNEEQLYCNSCHQFTAETQLVSLDSATGTLRPGQRQCFGCHEMRQLLATFDPDKDPHGGSCGMCHNPHTDAKPKDALKSCAESGCHSNWRNVPFHVGAAHRKVGERCATCHQPHAARVDASDCTGCHQQVRKGEGRLRPPVPFDTTKALRQSLRLVDPGRSRGQGDSPPTASPSDTFSHQRHRKLACITCHSTTSRRSDLTFERPRGCQICHHQAPARSQCSSCHESDEVDVARPLTVEIAVPNHAPRPRPVVFEHTTHGKLACAQCHTTPVSLEPEPRVKACIACHDEHHTSPTNCAACHRTAQITPAHAQPVDAHAGCVECHDQSTVSQLTPGRSFCLTCHSSNVDHFAPRECSQCHLLSSPQAYRAHLSGRGPGR
jgi:hypothetical protein